MSASIDVTGLAHFSRSLRRAVTGDLQKELVANIQDAGPKIVLDMRGEARTRIEQRAASGVTVARKTDGIVIDGKGGGGLGAALFDGGEYGGRATKKRTYPVYKVYGRSALAVSKRATMMFKPHLGNEGHWFWPTVRDWLPKLVQQQEAAIDKALGGR